jgi:hypothetical protein
VRWVVCWEFAAAAAATLARRLNSGSSRSWVASVVALTQRARRYRGLRGRVGGRGYDQTIVESIATRVSVLVGFVGYCLLNRSAIQRTSDLHCECAQRVLQTTGRLRADENARARPWQAPPVRPLFCARFKGRGGALAVDYGGSPADGRGTESSVLNGGVVEGWLTAGIHQQTSTYGAYRDCAVELHWRWAGFPTGSDA